MNRIEFALTFLPPPEPDIFGGERGGGGGGGEGREREREIKTSLSLSLFPSLSLSLSAPCVLRRAGSNMDFLVKVFLVSFRVWGKNSS